jgi:hypothetical protein
MNRTFRLTGELRPSWLSILAVLCVFGVACGPADSGEEPMRIVTTGGGDESTACTPGETQACLGPGACDGAQICLSDGSGYGDCDCGAAGTEADDSTATTSGPGTTDPDPGDPGQPNDPTEQPDEQQDTDPQPDASCPNPDSTNWPASSRIIVDSVDWENDRIVLRNVTDSNISLENWAVHLGETLLTLHFVSGFTVPADDTFEIRLREDGTNEATLAYWGGTGPEFDLGYANGDVSVHSDVDALDSPAALEAYVRWGDDPTYPDDNHRDEAAAAGLWANGGGEFVQTSSSDQGVMAVGDVTAPTGYAGVASKCMP